MRDFLKPLQQGNHIMGLIIYIFTSLKDICKKKNYNSSVYRFILSLQSSIVDTLLCLEINFVEFYAYFRVKQYSQKSYLYPKVTFRKSSISLSHQSYICVSGKYVMIDIAGAAHLIQQSTSHTPSLFNIGLSKEDGNFCLISWLESQGIFWVHVTVKLSEIFILCFAVESKVKGVSRPTPNYWC